MAEEEEKENDQKKDPKVKEKQIVKEEEVKVVNLISEGDQVEEESQ